LDEKGLDCGDDVPTIEGCGTGENSRFLAALGMTKMKIMAKDTAVRVAI
jgi:hypothetical protein